MTEDTRQIEIAFPVPVELTNDDMRQLDAITGEICERYKRSHPGRIMWPAGVGSKVLYMPMTKAEEDAGRHIEFSDDIFAIDCSEREDYDWLCAKCGIKQGDHKDCILDPPAGECEFEPEKRDLGPECERGLVPMRVYLSAVGGRRKMREALVVARARVKELKAAASPQPDRESEVGPLLAALIEISNFPYAGAPDIQMRKIARAAVEKFTSSNRPQATEEGK